MKLEVFLKYFVYDCTFRSHTCSTNHDRADMFIYLTHFEALFQFFKVLIFLKKLLIVNFLLLAYNGKVRHKERKMGSWGGGGIK